MKSMFEILTELPLFRGVTHERIAATVGMAKFHFLKYAPGETIVEAGEACTHIKFVIDGEIRISISGAGGRFKIMQTLAAPDVISPDYLFGPSTIYPGTITAVGETSIVQITKSDYMKILASDNIYMFNFLNYLSMNAQKSVEGILSILDGNIPERLAMWISCMTQPTAKDIAIICRQRDLYAMLGVQRSSYMAAIDDMVQAGLIKYEPGRIDVIDRRAMLEQLRP
ncbi:MAG: Crp/Fnr family transcriptional regulator [Muribaculaceae bacterium]|nr:Crp/Fnr family transcriptional regulator [Muribaculaceae bacterium]